MLVSHTETIVKNVIIICMALVLAGCAASDTSNRQNVSTFTPTSGTTWQMRATAALGVDKADHQRWIAKYLNLNGMCPDGYTITNEQDILVRHAALTDITDIIYTGRCNP